MSVLTFTIPNDPRVRRAMAEYLLDDPGVLKLRYEEADAECCGSCGGSDTSRFEAKIPVSEGGTMLEEEPAPTTGGQQQESASDETLPAGEDLPSLMESRKNRFPAILLDKDGLPWDERIHSGSKALLKDGTWRKKKNTPPELVEQVKAELKALMATPAPEPAPKSEADKPPFYWSHPESDSCGIAKTEAELEEILGSDGCAVQVSEEQYLKLVQEQQEPAPVPPPPDPTENENETGIVDMQGLMLRITGEGVPLNRVLEVIEPHGITALPALGARPDLIPQVAAELFGE